MRTSTTTRSGDHPERGAALVEFALIFPIFMTLVLGMFSGGQSYDRKITITNAAREASRYGATLPVSNFKAPFTLPATTSLQAWLVSVADLAEQNAGNDLGPGVAGRSICVAYVFDNPDTTATNDQTTRLMRTTINSFSKAPCYSDGRPSTERRVQVRVTRPSKIQGLFFSFDVTLTAESLTRFEAATS